MFVELLETILEGGRVKASIRPGREPIAFVKGATIEVSEATGAKWIEKGIAKAVETPVLEEVADA